MTYITTHSDNEQMTKHEETGKLYRTIGHEKKERGKI